MIRQSIRRLHSASKILQQVRTTLESAVGPAVEPSQETTPKQTLGKGKKKAAVKPNLVILDAKQSRLVRKVPSYFQSHKQIKLNPLEFQQQRKKLEKFQTRLSQEEAFKTLDLLKPSKNEISLKRYEQLAKDIFSTFTINELRGYIRSKHPEITGVKTQNKSKCISKLVKEGWRLSISDKINPEEDLIVTRDFDFDKKQLFLLLIQRAFDNWIRANVKIEVHPFDTRVIIRANKAHIQYIELAIQNILKSVKSEEIDLHNVEALYKHINESIPLEDIQKLSGVFFEEKQDTESEYLMYSFGNKRFSEAKRLMLWSLDYNPFTKLNLHTDLGNQDLRLFNVLPNLSVPWIHRNKDWVRIRAPKTLNRVSPPINIDTQKIYEELYNVSSAENLQRITAVTFGELLHDPNTIENPQHKTIMNTNIPFAHERILKLPLMTTENIQDGEDYHSYFAQLKFVPSPFQTVDNYSQYPPLELWFDVNSEEKAEIDSLQAVTILNETSSAVSLPYHPTDLLFIRSDSETLIEPSDGSESWLQDQPGIKKFLEEAVLDFNGRARVKIPDYVEVKLPNVEDPIRYEYVSMSYRRHLDLKFRDRLLQFAVIEGGALGGRTAELLIVGKHSEDMTKEEFEMFTKDAIDFVESLERRKTNELADLEPL